MKVLLNLIFKTNKEDANHYGHSKELRGDPA